MVHKRLSDHVVGKKLTKVNGNRKDYHPLLLREFLESFILEGEEDVKTLDLYERLYIVYKDISECNAVSNPAEAEQLKLDAEAAWNTIQLLRTHSTNPRLNELHSRLENKYGILDYHGKTR